MENMENILEILNQSVEFEAPPADLCLKCGKCCKTIVSDIPEEQLLEMVKNNEEEAKVFFNVFKKYDDIEAAKAVNPEHTSEIISRFKKDKRVKNNQITFYYCPYLSEDNLCTIYPRRPECCKRAPINGWALFPEGCGYEGWQFVQREKHKSRIRKLKEFLYELETLISDEEKLILGMPVKELKQRIMDKILEYEQFGVKNW